MNDTKKITHIDKFSPKAKKLWLKIQTDCNELQTICEKEKNADFDEKWFATGLMVDVHPAIQLKKDPQEKRKSEKARANAKLLREAGCDEATIRASLISSGLPTEGIVQLA